MKPPRPIIRLAACLRGDTWPGFRLAISPDPLVAWPGVRVDLDWRVSPRRDSLLGTRWSSVGEGALISTSVDNDALVVEVAAHVPEMKPGLWYSDLQLSWPDQLDATGRPLTHTLADFCWTIVDDKTE